MKVLVIPDIHLKPWMFRRASELMEEKGKAIGTQEFLLIDTVTWEFEGKF